MRIIGTVVLVLAMHITLLEGEDYKPMVGINALIMADMDEGGEQFTWGVPRDLPKPYDQLRMGKQGSIGGVDDDEYAAYYDVDLRTANRISISYASGTGTNSNYVEVRLDSLTGDVLDTVAIPNTGGWSNWTTVFSAIDDTDASGVHNLYFVFRGQAHGIGDFILFVLIDEDAAWDPTPALQQEFIPRRIVSGRNRIQRTIIVHNQTPSTSGPHCLFNVNGQFVPLSGAASRNDVAPAGLYIIRQKSAAAPNRR